MGGFSRMANLVTPSLAVGRGGGAMGGGGGGDAPPPAASLQVFPWWFYPPPAATYFYVDSLAATGASQVIAAGAQDVRVDGSAFIVEDGDRAVIVAIALVTQLPLAADDFTWALKRNGGIVQGLGQLRNFAVPANAAVREFSGYAIKLEPGDEVEWFVTNNGAAPVTVSVNYQGWRAAVNEIERIQQGVNY